MSRDDFVGSICSVSDCVVRACVDARVSNLVLRPVTFWMALLSACCVASGVEHSTNYLSTRHTHTNALLLLSVCVSLNDTMITTDLVSGRGTSPGNERNWWGELWAGCSLCKQITGWFGWDPLRAPQQGCRYVACKTSMSLMNYTWENVQQWNWESGRKQEDEPR